ncbi:Fcf1-domain-containing protein [Blastocladiella britannica]|nr:Fcf1-domain-containing protein [Blastocladiella britannica]
MKVKRQKTCRRIMQLYCSSFSFREPYQMIADGTFVNVALRYRIDLRTALPSTLSADVKLFTTPCIQAEMRGLGHEYMGAVLASKRFESRRCGHKSGTHSAAACVRSLIGETNPHHLMVGTQDETLRGQLRDVPGTPLVYLSSSVMVLEPHSHATMRAVDTAERAKNTVSDRERARIAAKVASIAPESMTAAAAAGVGLDVAANAMPKRKKVKGPNPLSIKKKVKAAPVAASKTASGAAAAGVKRKRGEVEMDEEAGSSAQDGEDDEAEPLDGDDGTGKPRRRKRATKKRKRLASAAVDGR